MKSSLACCVCVLLLSCLITPGAAQQRFSGATIDASRLTLGVDSLAIFFVRGPDTTRIGTVWDELRTIDNSGAPELQRIYRVQNELLGARVDTIVSVVAQNAQLLAEDDRWAVYDAFPEASS